MSPVATFFFSPRLNLPLAFASAVAEVISWFTTFDDPYRVTPIAFVLCVYFVSMLAIREHAEAERLREAIQPRLRLVFRPEEGDPYVVEKQTGGHSIRRIYRVGVQNLGKTTVPNVGVLLRDFMPIERDVRKKHAMVLMKPKEEEAAYETRADINASDEPLQFFQVASQQFGRADEYQPQFPQLEQAIGYTVFLRDNHEMYKFALEIDGASAGPPMGFVYQRNAKGIYELRQNEFSKL